MFLSANILGDFFFLLSHFKAFIVSFSCRHLPLMDDNSSFRLQWKTDPLGTGALANLSVCIQLTQDKIPELAQEFIPRKWNRCPTNFAAIDFCGLVEVRMATDVFVSDFSHSITC